MDNLNIVGFKATIDSIDETLKQMNDIKNDGEIIQLLNADSIVSKNHIIHGVNQAFLAFSRDENLANDISVEIVLRCSAQRQISKAFNILGLKEGNVNLCAVFINCDYTEELSSLFSRDDEVFAADENRLKKGYGISEDELKTMSMENIIIDRITKLTVNY
ncbi:KEOPS complex subunit Cgi121 [uncultured Methanobrevibacter sp.]|uniref:KEOPS complex subunit Cgi121 n=1 Tax=uncultured Methanobrevibacter sp. TaxID=253161 RepID=UPI0025F148AC|nr:KEOPS complex subunit Cgi121 [uncultured Methanobrevibacter sp.]